MAMSAAYKAKLDEAGQERENLLAHIGTRSLSAAMLTRELYPDAAYDSPEYQHIRYQLNKMVKLGQLLCDEPQPSQERRYFRIQMRRLI